MNSLIKKNIHKTNDNFILKDNPFDNVPRFNESEIKELEYLPSFSNSNHI